MAQNTDGIALVLRLNEYGELEGRTIDFNPLVELDHYEAAAFFGGGEVTRNSASFRIDADGARRLAERAQSDVAPKAPRGCKVDLSEDGLWWNIRGCHRIGSCTKCKMSTKYNILTGEIYVNCYCAG